MNASPAGADRLSLFGGEDVIFDHSFSGGNRRQLDEASLIEVIPGWLSGHEQLMARMIALVPFEHHQRWIHNRLYDEPRLTAVYPQISECPVPVIRMVAEALSARYGLRYDGVWLNLYRSERDSTGWHGDWETCKRTECVVPVLSVGATRRFLIKPRSGGRSVSITVAGGDLVIMGGRCQRDWVHSVPKQLKAAGPRVSLNFQSTYQMTRDGATRR